jgi:NAD+ synthetase
MKYRKAVENIRKELKQYLMQHHLESLIIGISGGIDSAICVALAQPVCEKLKIKFIGRSLPIQTNKDEEISRAKSVGNTFNLEFKEVDLAKAYLNLSSEIKEDGKETEMEKKIREGNIKVRVRMVYLYNLAKLHNGMVLSTDNWSELMLGFWTLHGDVGDYGMIQNLDKTEVYKLSEYIVSDLKNKGEDTKAIALQDCIDAIPTDGLGITNSDLDQIQAESYQEVDEILHSYIDKRDNTFKDHPVILRYERTHFKRNNPTSIPRSKIFEA